LTESILINKSGKRNNLVKLFADGADKTGMLEMYDDSKIAGFTTNPTLMRKAGLINYAAFAKDILGEIKDKPVSFEVFADEFKEMERQALEIENWGKNVYVKIPIMNTKKKSSYDLIKALISRGVKLNITAIMTLEQIEEVAMAVKDGTSCFVSIFAGRIADTGVDPIPVMKAALEILKPLSNAELLWASPREVLNVYQAESIGCHIITATNDILKKLSLKGKNLTEYSRETVQMFYDDAKSSKYTI
jgi:transaldolase